MRKSISQTARNKVKAREGKVCQKCYRTENLELHHINPVANDGDNDPDNLVTLCTSCHREWEQIVYPNTNKVTFDQWLCIPPALFLIALFSDERYWPEDITAKQARDSILQSYPWIAPYTHEKEY